MANIVSPPNKHLYNNVIQTKKDKQMKATLNLKLFGARIIDLKKAESIYNVLNDPN